MSNCNRQEKHRNEYCSIYENQKMVREIDVYLNKNISCASHYSDLLNILRTSNPGDQVNLYINNGGGSLYSTLQIINAMKTSVACVRTILDGAAFSGASMLFLAGDSYEVFPTSSMMCHYYSTVEIGKGSDIENSVNFNKKHFTNIFKGLYEGFLSDEELTSLLKGEDIWLNHAQILSRLKKRNAYLKKLEEDAQKKQKRSSTKKKTNK